MLTMTTLRRLWTSNAPLTAAGLLMVAALAAFLAGLWLDPRVITGAPAWLKPAKFAASTAIFMFTLAWMFSYLPGWPRLRRTVGWIAAATLVLEVGLIALQAWRGTTSHFNVGTPLDAAVFAVMGAGILVQTASSVAVTVALWRQPFADRAFGWALRLGMVIALLGASTGGLMTRPTAAQLADARAGHRMTVVGAHTVGAADGGPGLPGTGWSLQHGDLRVPHFVGLHAMQMLPLIALLLVRRSGGRDAAGPAGLGGRRQLLRAVRAAAGAGASRGSAGGAVAGDDRGVHRLGVRHGGRGLDRPRRSRAAADQRRGAGVGP